MKHRTINFLQYMVVGSMIFSSILVSSVALAANENDANQNQSQDKSSWNRPQGGPGGGRGMIGNRAPGIFGTVSAISGSSLTVVSKGFGQDNAEKTYSVDARDAVVIKDQATSTLDSIAVGDSVMVHGTVDGTSVTAKLIHDGMQMRQDATPIIEGNGDPVIGGTVSAKNGSTLTVKNKSNVTYTVDASDAKIQKDRREGSLSDIEINDTVIIQGVVNGNEVKASSVVDSGIQKSQTDENGQNAGHKGLRGFFGGFMGGLFHHLFGFF